MDMLRHYRLLSIWKAPSFFWISSVIWLLATQSFAQETGKPDQYFPYIVNTGEFALELVSSDTDRSIFLPLAVLLNEEEVEVAGLISTKQDEVANFYFIGDRTEVYLVDMVNYDRVDTIVASASPMPLTPCPEGYCLPPWLFEINRELDGGNDAINRFGVPIVSSQDFSLFFRPAFQ